MNNEEILSCCVLILAWATLGCIFVECDSYTDFKMYLTQRMNSHLDSSFRLLSAGQNINSEHKMSPKQILPWIWWTHSIFWADKTLNVIPPHRLSSSTILRPNLFRSTTSEALTKKRKKRASVCFSFCLVLWTSPALVDSRFSIL